MIFTHHAHIEVQKEKIVIDKQIKQQINECYPQAS